MQDGPKRNPTLLVAAGAHSGATAVLRRGRTRVGSTPDCEIIISDAGGLAPAFIIENGPDVLTLTAGIAPLGLDRGGSVESGQRRRISAPTRFSVANLDFCLQPGSETAPRLRRARQGSAWSGAALTASIVAAVAIGAGLFATPAPAVQANGTSRPGNATADSSNATAPHATREALRQSFKRKLASAALNGIELADQPDGSIEATGQINPEQQTTWRQATQAFDTDAGGRIVLVDQVRIAAEAPPLTIQAVWPGNDPYVIDGAGEKLFVGSLLASGWTIHSIGEHRVTLDRAGRALAVQF